MNRPTADPAADPASAIAFQGRPGAYSHLACREAYPDMAPLPCPAFEDAFDAVREGRARLGMIPIENSTAGRVADIHHLMPHCGLHIVGEHFQRVNHHLLAPKGATLDGIRAVHSHPQALRQCRRMLREHGLTPQAHADTAGAAADVAARGRTDEAAIASRLAADIYGLDVLAADIEDAEHNTTRFVVLAREPAEPPPDDGPTVTTFLFRVRNVPAALYKALGGFATNGVNMLKLESYVDSRFNQAQFYADVLGHPARPDLKRALDELRFFSEEVEVLGVYPADPFRSLTAI
ncbi:MAG TPA: prephenate dehydratase [Geminicoccaceae bacterium]|nr:prephenate dehydratase [Geminicoccaceae bacterium]